jgi:hypothetical protein
MLQGAGVEEGNEKRERMYRWSVRSDTDKFSGDVETAACDEHECTTCQPHLPSHITSMCK